MAEKSGPTSPFSARAKKRMTSRVSANSKTIQLGPAVPGVGTYTVPSTFAKAAAKGRVIGPKSPRRLQFGTLWVDPNAVVEGPGPGAHDGKDPSRPGIGDGGQKSSLYSKREHRTIQVPGPGEYEGKDLERPLIGVGGPKPSMYGRREFKPLQYPGPGQYNHPDPLKKAKRKGKPLGSKSKRNVLRAAGPPLPKFSTPGPGSHDISKTMAQTMGASGRKATMGHRRHDPNYYLVR